MQSFFGNDRSSSEAPSLALPSLPDISAAKVELLGSLIHYLTIEAQPIVSPIAWVNFITYAVSIKNSLINGEISVSQFETLNATFKQLQYEKEENIDLLLSYLETARSLQDLSLQLDILLSSSFSPVEPGLRRILNLLQAQLPASLFASTPGATARWLSPTSTRAAEGVLISPVTTVISAEFMEFVSPEEILKHQLIKDLHAIQQQLADAEYELAALGAGPLPINAPYRADSAPVLTSPASVISDTNNPPGTLTGADTTVGTGLNAENAILRQQKHALIARYFAVQKLIIEKTAGVTGIHRTAQLPGSSKAPALTPDLVN